MWLHDTLEISVADNWRVALCLKLVMAFNARVCFGGGGDGDIYLFDRYLIAVLNLS